MTRKGVRVVCHGTDCFEAAPYVPISLQRMSHCDGPAILISIRARQLSDTWVLYGI